MNTDDLERFGKEIELMFLANSRDVPSVGQIAAYWQTLSALTWEEFKDGMFNARQKSGAGFMPNDGAIYAEAMKARDFLRERFEKAQRAKALDEVRDRIPEEWKDRKPATAAELSANYERDAEMAKANYLSAKGAIEHTPPGDPGLGDLIMRRDRCKIEYWDFVRLARLYASKASEERGESKQW